MALVDPDFPGEKLINGRDFSIGNASPDLREMRPDHACAERIALTAKIFGRDKVGLMFGRIVAADQIGVGAIAYLAGLIRTTQGSYDHAFLLSGAACLLTAASGRSTPEPSQMGVL